MPNNNESRPQFDSKIEFQFSINRLLLVVFVAAVFSALLRVNFTIAIVTIPLTIGPLVGLFVSNKPSGMVLGWLSATFWSIVCGLMTIPFGELLTEQFSTNALNLIALFYFTVIGLIAGYVGGRIALH